MTADLLDRRRSVRVPPPETLQSRRRGVVARRLRAAKMHRLKIHVGAWLVGSAVSTALWMLTQWDAHGAFRHFGNSGNPGDWNPTLWALVVGGWGLFVGIKALRVYVGPRFRFHAAAWALGMIVLTPLWALIEWQDNGGFARWSAHGNRGDWEPWVAYVGGIWAFMILAMAVRAYLDARAARAARSDR